MRILPRWLYRFNRLRWAITRPLTVGVRLILTRGRTVLLVQHTYQRDWYLPGGGVRRAETLEEAARREATEEVGAELGPLRLFGVYNNFHEHKSDHMVVFSCEDFTLTGQKDRGIDALRFFEWDDLPPGVSPGSRRRIEEFEEGGGPPTAGVW